MLRAEHGNKTPLKSPRSPARKTPIASSPARNGERGGGEEPAASGRTVTPNLKMFTLAELKAATRNFRPDTVLGEGGFGRVFKGWVDEKSLAPSKVGVGMAVAVKKSSPDSEQGIKEWQVPTNFPFIHFFSTIYNIFPLTNLIYIYDFFLWCVQLYSTLLILKLIIFDI